MRNEQLIELLILSGFESKEVLKKMVSPQDIQKIMTDIDWEIFHLVMLSRSDHDWIEVGGNLKEDGLACMFEKNNEQFVIDETLNSVEQMTEILISFYHNDGEFLRKYKFTGESEKKKHEEEDLKKFEDWKLKFEQKSRAEKKSNFRRFLLSVAILFTASSIVYYGFSGDLKFLGQKTEFTKAKIVNTQMEHFGKGKYFQVVKYEFHYKGNTYFGQFRAGKRIGKQKVGGFIQVKFSINNPNRSQMESVYRD